VSAVVLVIFYSLLTMSFHATAFLFPVVLLPFVLLTLGATWFIASLSVYLRDVAQLVGIVSTALLFLSPILYPISAVPEQYRHFIYLSPLTFVINQGRDVLLWGHMPDWPGLGAYYAVSAFVAWAGFFWFQKTRRGFADVL
jgi:lipopolysaccharide transport system permease protein